MKLLAATTAVIAALALAAGAQAGRLVPRGFWGANWSFEITNAPQSLQNLQWRRMATSGVESQRALFLWSAAQGRPHQKFNFTQSDHLVQMADAHGIELLPVVAFGAPWTLKYPYNNSPPRDPREYAAYLTALVHRYGPHGSFWARHRHLPKRPIRAWQIWNEPSANYQWTIPQGQDWAPGYAALLKASYRAVKHADRGARVVLAGLPNFSDTDLEHLYQVGHIHGFFDVAALHPFTASDHGVLTLTERFRAVMRRHGDGRKPLWITELGLPASKGKSSDPSPLQTDDAGMSRYMQTTFSDFTTHHRWRSLGVDHLFWFTWASSYSGWIFEYTGLWLYFPHYGHGPDTLQAKPALATYQHLARRAEGCAKTASGACRRAKH